MHRPLELKLFSLDQAIEVSSIAEVGVWRGDNAALLRQFFPKAHLYLVDSWNPIWYDFYKGQPISTDIDLKQARIIRDDFTQAFIETMRKFKRDPQVTILQKTSKEAASLIPNHLDLVFIDGSHDYESVKDDILNWKKKIRPGGILSGHDFHPNFPGVMQAVKDCLGDQYYVG